MQYYHVDVFSSEPFSGNGLAVVFHEHALDEEYMLKTAQEFKQYETVFLRHIQEKRYRARIYTVQEELDFAGHPILGAASAIHERNDPREDRIELEFVLNRKTVRAVSVRQDGFYRAEMNQGLPAFLGCVNGEIRQMLLAALHLSPANLYDGLPMEVVSTGLPYLIVPLASGLEEVKIVADDFAAILEKAGAKFAYIVDITAPEGRTWDNTGAYEDIATGSAAGPTAAYLFKHNICKSSEPVVINQGRFVGRPSRMKAYANSSGELFVAGDVKILVKGEIL